MEALLPGVIDIAFDRLPKDERYSHYMESFRQNNPQGYGSLALGMVGTDNTKILSALTIPALIAVGENDILLPPEMSRKVHGLLGNSEFVIIQKAAHFAPYQAPYEFARLVCDFIDKCVETCYTESH
jgi:pimeloyl-ACP methyl ester carboxylesterase